MPTVKIPVTTYSVRETNPGHKYGSPAENPLRSGGVGDAWVLCRVPVDKVPEDATITSATLKFWTSQAETGSITMRVYPNTEPWKSSVSWNTRPARDAVIDTDAHTNPAKNTLYQFDILSWVLDRSRYGLSVDISTTPAAHVHGSSASVNQPVLIVEYTVLPEAPSNLVPDGGAVSVSTPVLAFESEEDISQLAIQFSDDGTVSGIVYDSGWLTRADGRYDPADDPGSNPSLSSGEEIWWRARTNGPGGTSPWSGWATYSYEPLENPVIVNPPSTTDDGTPTLTWTITNQTSWKAEFWSDTKLLDSTAWDEDSATRDWIPNRGIKVPGGAGRFVLKVRDDVVPRVASEGAPVIGSDEQEFTTVLSGAGTAINTLSVALDGPVPVLSGNRSLGTPDEVALVRDGEIVPLWDADGDPHRWAPAVDFFTGGNFVLPDYTAPPRSEHTWSVRTRASSVVSALGPTVTETLWVPSVWLVDPETGNRVEIQGYNDTPVIEQTTAEASILHVPIQGDLIVEPVRRRLVRTTRSGSISGVVLNDDEDQLDSWVNRGSNRRYRLIFGKVNWLVIIGDYNPSDVFYSDECSDERVLITLNWWERLADY